MKKLNLPININDLLTARTVEWERLEFKAISRCYRNRRIGEFLKELDMTEGRSTGIPKILRVMKRNGSPKPEFETDEDRLHFLIRLPVHSKATAQAVENSEAPVEAPVILTETEKKILASLKDRDLARNELLHIFGYSQPTGNFKKAIEKLLQHALIERTIPDKPNSRLQKYRLTQKGKKQVESIK